GEWYSPTQPIPVKPPPIARVSFDPETDIVTAEHTTEAHAAACRALWDEVGYYNAGPYTPFRLREEGQPPTLLFPALTGGGNRGGVAIDPERKRVVVHAQGAATVGWMVPHPRDSGEASCERAPWVLGRGPPFAAPLGGGADGSVPCHAPPWASLLAIDAEAGEIV